MDSWRRQRPDNTWFYRPAAEVTFSLQNSEHSVVVSQNIRDMTTILPLHVVGFILTEIAISFRLTEIHHTRVRGAKEEEEVLDVAIQYSK